MGGGRAEGTAVNVRAPRPLPQGEGIAPLHSRPLAAGLQLSCSWGIAFSKEKMPCLRSIPDLGCSDFWPMPRRKV